MRKNGTFCREAEEVESEVEAEVEAEVAVEPETELEDDVVEGADELDAVTVEEEAEHVQAIGTEGAEEADGGVEVVDASRLALRAISGAAQEPSPATAGFSWPILAATPANSDCLRDVRVLRGDTTREFFRLETAIPPPGEEARRPLAPAPTPAATAVAAAAAAAFR